MCFRLRFHSTILVERESDEEIGLKTDGKSYRVTAPLNTFIENLLILMIRHWTKNVIKILSIQS